MELISTEKGIELIHKNGNWIIKKEIGFSPVELLVASIAACGAYVYERVLTNSKITYKTQRVEVAYERSETKPAKPLSEVTITFYLEVPESEQGKAERATKLITKNCPVMQSLDPEIKVFEQVIFV
ncbi:OsmC family protein [Enterococcus rivorum]|uniref:Peroxiredoxin n=1 Tax=Enterococcus rivorum TaxID=762845 RepID=A0A1E5L126_9ENTE|nr:OsmC family protein [Enterococcus rivorum]MBP2098677.1 putative OsmC-like protein [Enterococcus rivorum]OEH83771.1 peroxiredoxin [Enterococcus rivorum]